MPFKGTLIRSGNNAKTVKGDGEYETAIMYLAPHKAAGGANVCPMAEQAGCIAGCLNTAGRGAYDNVQAARIAKTRRYLSDRKQFMAELVTDLEKFERYCRKRGVKPVVRLNGTSDIQWEVAHPVERPYTYRDPVTGEEQQAVDRYASIFHAFPFVTFYDYTKVYKRVYRALPTNYTLVLSYSEADRRYSSAIEKAFDDTGCNVAVVYRTKELRDRDIKACNQRGRGIAFGYTGRTAPVIDGDSDDMRFLDPKGVIVGLYAKGRARKDTSGFVIG